MDFKNLFDWKFYVNNYKDLIILKNNNQAWFHVNNYGWKENRIIFENNKINDAFYAFKNGKDINVQKDINIEVENVGINMYNINSFSSIDIETIKKNILQFSENIKKYKNILFICGDYPGYGGAATNCYELQKYFKTIGHNTFGFYFNYETGANAKHEKYEDHIIDDVCNFKSVEFKPDLIILKSPINIDLKLLFKSPVYYLIGGIYKNDLDIYYYNLNSKKQSDKYINNHVLNHIAKYDKSFVNSQHTMDILKKFYDVSTNIFYSSFVSYVNKKVLIDPDFEKRKYDYGLIVSNFDRKIKNIDKSIKFLKDKENVILIGGGSERYKSYGFTCIDLVDKEEMNKYYKQIKYIVQDSFFESCSNVRIEGLFNGCNVIKSYNVVIASTQYPGYGGAASVAYDYHKKLLDEGYNSKLFFFLNKKEFELMLPDSNLYNPSSYNNVYYLLSQNFHDKKEQYSDFNVANTIIAFNYGIIPIIKKQFSGELIYYVTGSPELTLGENSPVNNNISYENFMNESNYKYLLDSKQSKLNLMNLELADKVVVSCEIVKNLYIKFYPQFSNKYIIEPFEKNIYEYKHKLVTYNNKILFNDRKYFIICATSSWKRPVKNIELIYNIFKHFPDENKVIIGTQNDKYNFKDIPNTTVLDIISNNELHRFLCNSKNYILPSFFESASITLLEALHNGCNVITSRNVGLSYLIPENNIVDDFENLRSWTNCINTQANNKCILFISYNIPGYGGASTNIYEMYQYIKNIGISTYVIFIEKNYDELKVNKEDLDKDPNVFIVKKYDKQTEYSNIISVLSKFKDVCVIFKISKTINLIQNYLIPYINISYIVYLCSGLASVNSYINNNFNNQYTKPFKVDKFIDDISQQSLYSNYINNDLIPINASNITIFNSNHTYNIIKKLCEKNNFQIESNCKVINTSIAFKKKQNNNNNNKLFDLIFSSSSYTRHTKNSVLACKLFSHSRLIPYKKLIIGKDFPDYIKKIPNLTYIDENISHKDFIKFLNESKILFLPSFYDSMPNILYESICSHCIPFVSDTIECNLLFEHNFFSLYMTNDEILDKIYNLLNEPINQNNTQNFIDEQNHNRKTILEILKISTM